MGRSSHGVETRTAFYTYHMTLKTPMRRLAVSALLLPVTLAATGCMRPAAIWLADNAQAGALTFRVARSRTDLRPVASLDRITVRACEDQPGAPNVFWVAQRDSAATDPLPTSITYGVPPAGFRAVGGPKPLTGVCVEAVVSGAGVAATVRFVVHDDGSITERHP